MIDAIVAIIVAVVTGAFAVIGQIILSNASNSKVLAELQRRSEISDVKIEGKIEQLRSIWDVKLSALTESVNRHNAFADRIPVMEEKIKTMDGRITDLEKEVHHHG